MALTN